MLHAHNTVAFLTISVSILSILDHSALLDNARMDGASYPNTTFGKQSVRICDKNASFYNFWMPNLDKIKQ